MRSDDSDSSRQEATDQDGSERGLSVVVVAREPFERFSRSIDEQLERLVARWIDKAAPGAGLRRSSTVPAP